MYHGSTSSHGQKGEEFENIQRFNLVIYQLRRDWLTRDSIIIFYHKRAMKIVDNFEIINFEHLPRVENQMADALATLVAMFQINSNDEV